MFSGCCLRLREDKRQLCCFHTLRSFCKALLCLLSVLVFYTKHTKWNFSYKYSAQQKPWINTLWYYPPSHYLAEWYWRKWGPPLFTSWWSHYWREPVAEHCHKNGRGWSTILTMAHHCHKSVCYGWQYWPWYSIAIDIAGYGRWYWHIVQLLLFCIILSPLFLILFVQDWCLHKLWLAADAPRNEDLRLSNEIFLQQNSNSIWCIRQFQRRTVHCTIH